MYEKKAQGAIEYLLIIGAAILVVAVVIVAITSVLQSGKTNTNDDSIEDDQLKMIFATGGGTIKSNTIQPGNTQNGQLPISLETTKIYVTKSKIGTTQEDFSNAFSRGYYIVYLDEKDVRTLNYTYSSETNPNTQPNNSVNITCWGGGMPGCAAKVKVIPTTIGKKVSVQFIDYNRSS